LELIMKEQMTPENIREVELYAWVGEDELGSGVVGLKQALTPAGYIPLVATQEFKMSQEYLTSAMQQQSTKYGKTIRLCKFTFVETVITVTPDVPNN